MKTSLLSFALITLGTCAAWAGSICPAASGANTFPHPADPAATGCNVVITINAGGSISVAVTDATPYENSEDVMVGVVNNSSSNVPSISITGNAGNDIFGLDGDGMCTFTFVGSSYCSGAVYLTDPGDYYGPNTTFSNISASGLAGTVNFTSPLAPGGTAYFSLEGVPSGSLTVVAGTPTSTSVVGAPAMSDWALVLLAGLLIGYAWWAMLKNRAIEQ